MVKMDSAGNASDSDQLNSQGGSNHDDSLSDECLPDLSMSTDKDLTSADEDLDDRTFLKELKLLFGRSIKRKRMNRGRQDKTKRFRKVPIDLVSPRATSRCNLSYFYKIIKELSETQKYLISKVGFGSLLQFVYCAVLRLFAKWIAKNVNVKNKDILVGGKRIPLNPLSVNNVLGIPLGGKDVSSTSEDAKSSFLALFGCSTLPTIKFFGRKFLKEDLTDDEFIRCFMVVALSTFLCPTSSTLPSPKYLGALLVIDDIKNYDRSKYVFDWLICYIEKYQKALSNMSLTRTLGGCIYDLAVYYLDFVDFGDHVIPATIPRISVWKGDMIKNFSQMDIDLKNKHIFGRRPIKDFCSTCYATSCTTPQVFVNKSTSRLSHFRNAMTIHLGQSVPNKVKDHLCMLFDKYQMNTSDSDCSNMEELVLAVLKYLLVPEVISNLSWSEQNCNIDAPQDCGMKVTDVDGNNHTSGTQSTEKVNCDEEEYDNEICNGSQTTLVVNSTDSRDKINHQDEISAVESLFSKEHPMDVICATNQPNNPEASLIGTQKDGADTTQKLPLSLPSAPLPHSVGVLAVEGGQNQNPKDVASIFSTTTSASLDHLLAANANLDVGPTNSKPSSFVKVTPTKNVPQQLSFVPDDIPSFRLGEWMDDAGNYIEEKNLWRPLRFSKHENPAVDTSKSHYDSPHHVSSSEEKMHTSSHLAMLPSHHINSPNYGASWSRSTGDLSTKRASQGQVPIIALDVSDEEGFTVNCAQPMRESIHNQNSRSPLATVNLCAKFNNIGSPEVVYVGERSF